MLTIEGKAIALNCGAAKKAASSFYLPLHRIKRALDLLVEGQPVPRGTLQTVFKHMAFDEVRGGPFAHSTRQSWGGAANLKLNMMCGYLRAEGEAPGPDE